MEDDGTVIRTGVCADISEEKEYYDGAVVPGLVNAHCHVELSHLKGRFRKGSGMAGFIDQINELRDVVGRDEKNPAALGGNVIPLEAGSVGNGRYQQLQRLF